VTPAKAAAAGREQKTAATTNRRALPAVILAVPMHAAPEPPLPVPRGPVIRLSLMGVLLAALLYLALSWSPLPPAAAPAPNVPPPLVVVPRLDAAVLQQALDDTHEHRLLLEAGPLRHLLAQSLDVGDASAEVAQALGRPTEPVPAEVLRRDPGGHRGKWLWYRGRLEELSEPKDGHPVPGYAIRMATLRLPDDSLLLFAFSHPPGDGVQRGATVRAEGYLLKLRDLALPTPVEQVPMLVGPRLLRDYDRWEPPAALDQSWFADVHDGDLQDGIYRPGADSRRDLAADQVEPLWRLAAWVRQQSGKLTRADWQQLPLLDADRVWPRIRAGELERGTPLRLLGTLVRARTLQAAPNPAGIDCWTEAWVQVPDFGDKLVPLWIPDRIALPSRTLPLEMHGFYWKRLVYETQRNQEVVTPVFVATDLGPYFTAPDPLVHRMGLLLLSLLLLLGIGIVLLQRSELRQRTAHERSLHDRRRRRQQPAPPTPTDATPTPSP